MQNTTHVALRSLTLVLLIAALPSLAVGGVVGVDALSLDPAMVQPALAPPTQFVQDLPGTPNTLIDPYGSMIVLGYFATSPYPEPLPSTNISGVAGSTTVFAGDIVYLIDPNGGLASSNWFAVLRFLNPADPTGSLDLAATDEEAFFADNVGPGGFAHFSLFPNAVTAYDTQSAPSSIPSKDVYQTVLTEFGPEGAIPAGQTANIIYGVVDSAVPEPGALALLALGISSGLLFALRRRARRI